MTGSFGGETMNEQETPLVMSAIDADYAKRGQELSSEQVMRLYANPLVWHCSRGDCGAHFCFDGAQLESVPFLIVRHFVRAHGLGPDAIVAAVPCLADAVDDYCRRMAVPR